MERQKNLEIEVKENEKIYDEKNSNLVTGHSLEIQTMKKEFQTFSATNLKKIETLNKDWEESKVSENKSNFIIYLLVFVF